MTPARLLAILLVLALGPVLACGGKARERETTAADLVVVPDHFEAELLGREIFRVTNEVRVNSGIPALKPEPRLVAIATDQAVLLAMRIHSGHDSPLAHQADPPARAAKAGLPPGTVAENAATLPLRTETTGRDQTYRELAAVIVQAWMDSPGHRANLLNPGLHYLGCAARTARLVGVPQVYAVQDFYTPVPRSEPPPPTVRPGATGITR